MLVFWHGIRIYYIPDVWLWSHVDGQMCDLHVNRSHMRVEVSISPAPGVSMPVSPPPELSGQWGRTQQQQQYILQWQEDQRAGETRRTDGCDYQFLSPSAWGEKKGEVCREKGEKKCMRNWGGGGERSQCQCLGSDSSLFKGPSETCTVCPSAGSLSIQSDALSVCLSVRLTVSLSWSLLEEWVLLLVGPLGHNE